VDESEYAVDVQLQTERDAERESVGDEFLVAAAGFSIGAFAFAAAVCNGDEVAAQSVPSTA
jgi:hypothetical protein